MIRPLATLSFALIATLAASEARAVHRDPQGVGQVLIYPYYTVNAGHATLLSVVNTTDQARAIKLRFREAMKGRALLDVNLYLGAYDVYTAGVVADGDDGPVRLLSTDTSCIVSAGNATGATTALELRYDGPDDGRPDLQRTREGWIELIEMGVLADTNGDTFDVTTSFSDAATHVAGRPLGCDRLAAAWSGGVWSLDATRGAAGDSVGVTPPRGALLGGGAVIDVAQGVSYSFDADAIDGFFGLPQTTLHTPPGSDAPDLASAETTPGRARAIVVASGRLVELDFEAGRADAVSAVLMTEFLHNEFNISPTLAAASEWIVTFPTRHLHERHADSRRRPFAPASTTCEPFRVGFFDREVGPHLPPPLIDHPYPRRTPEFCHHAQVVAWGVDVGARGPTPLLGSRLLPDFGGYDDDRLLLDGDGQPVANGRAVLVPNAWPSANSSFLLDGRENAGQAPRHRLHGLPMTGLWMAKYQNSAARPGLFANYSTASRHRARVHVDAVLVTGEGTPGERITPATGQ